MVKKVVASEPSLAIGALLSVIVILLQVVGGGLTWTAASPIITGIVTRFLVSPSTASE